jgi:hypothetical protein
VTIPHNEARRRRHPRPPHLSLVTDAPAEADDGPSALDRPPDEHRPAHAAPKRIRGPETTLGGALIALGLLTTAMVANWGKGIAAELGLRPHPGMTRDDSDPQPDPDSSTAPAPAAPSSPAPSGRAAITSPTAAAPSAAATATGTAETSTRLVAYTLTPGTGRHRRPTLVWSDTSPDGGGRHRRTTTAPAPTLAGAPTGGTTSVAAATTGLRLAVGGDGIALTVDCAVLRHNGGRWAGGLTNINFRTYSLLN